MGKLTQALRERPMLGFAVSYPAPGIIERMAGEWDFVWLDGQHGQWYGSDVLAAVRTAELVGVHAMVRVPDHAYGNIGQALDTGASAVMVPMVNSADEAREVVTAAKFPPLGCRSYGSRRIVDRFDRAYSHTANEDSTLVVQIETPQAVESIDEICAVPGVDVVFFSPDDLRMHKGARMDEPPPAGLLSEAMETVARAAARHGKLCGAICGTPEAMETALRLGYRLINCCTDAGCLVEGSKRAYSTLEPVVQAWSKTLNAEDGK